MRSLMVINSSVNYLYNYCNKMIIMANHRGNSAVIIVIIINMLIMIQLLRYDLGIVWREDNPQGLGRS